jgi:hypothetical protein
MAAGSANFDNWFDNAADVYQADKIYKAEQQSFIYQAQARPPREPFHAWLRRLDRGGQIEQLIEEISVAQSEERSNPLVVVVKGTADDDLLGFVQRLREHDFEKDMGLPCDFLDPVEWPERSFHRMISKLIADISRARGETIPPRVAAQDRLMELIATHGRSIAFSHMLHPEVCRRRPELLQGWEDLFARTCRNPENGLLICFLCLQLHDPARASCDWLADCVGELAQRHRWCVLDTLPPLYPEDLGDWVASYNLRPVLSDVPFIDTGTADEVFSEDKPLRYREVRRRLLQILDPYLNPVEYRRAA